MATLQVPMDDNMKMAADSLFQGLGLDTSTAVRIFISASLDNHGLPFEVRKKLLHQDTTKKATEKITSLYKIVADTKPRPVFGSGKGKMWISDDFDAPLDELNEYME